MALPSRLPTPGVKRAPNAFSPNGEAVVEIRKLMDIEDFGEGFTPNDEIAKVKFK
jgi:hypothetical protein